MASPQLENGYTRVANEILEHLYGFGLNGGELAMCLMVLRKTYGFKGKKLDFISLSQFEKGLGYSHWYVSKIKRSLVSRRLLLSSNNRLGINKNWNEWGVSNSLPSKQQNNLPVSSSLHTKESITKENKTTPLNKNENNFSDEGEQVLDIETGEPVQKILKKEDPSIANDMWDLVKWATKEKRRGMKFPNMLKQFKALKTLRGMDVPPSEIIVRWEWLETQKFYQDSGIDFSTVVKSFEKKPL